ncbi:optic atrophy 3-like protein, partial [Dimargaris cristalligena]
MSTIKFASLLIRTIAKPIANSIKSQAKSHPNFRKVCISLAQTGHRVEMNLKMRFFGYKQDHIRPLNDAKAIETGANFLSEAIIFSVAGSVILFENQRSRLAARDRKNLVDDTLAQLEQDNVALREEMQRQ